ncbi:MAG: hypothetical protein ACPIOQ_20035 [Promethearchaeia archaeon]
MSPGFVPVGSRPDSPVRTRSIKAACDAPTSPPSAYCTDFAILDSICSGAHGFRGGENGAMEDMQGCKHLYNPLCQHPDSIVFGCGSRPKHLPSTADVLKDVVLACSVCLSA